MPSLCLSRLYAGGSSGLGCVYGHATAEYWIWIATVDGYTDFQTAHIFAGLAWLLAVFLAIIIAIEVMVAVYAHFRINSFAEETLNALR